MIARVYNLPNSAFSLSGNRLHGMLIGSPRLILVFFSLLAPRSLHPNRYAIASRNTRIREICVCTFRRSWILRQRNDLTAVSCIASSFFLYVSWHAHASLSFSFFFSVNYVELLIKAIKCVSTYLALWFYIKFLQLYCPLLIPSGADYQCLDRRGNTLMT